MSTKFLITRRVFELAVPAFVALAFLTPLLAWISQSTGPAFDPRIYTLAPLELTITLAYAGVATLVAVVLGTALALFHRFLPEERKRWFTYLVTLPMVVGFIARNFAWLAIFSLVENGLAAWLGREVHIAYEPATVVVVMTSAFVPLAFFIVSNGLRPLRNEQLEAAQLMGVPPDNLFRTIILPIVLRSASMASLLILAIAIAYFVTPRMIGGGKVNFIGSTVIQFLNKGHTTFANQLGLTLLLPAALISAALAFLIYRWRGRQLGF